MADHELLFLRFLPEASGRAAEICEEIDSVWLYLSEAGSTKVAVATWLLNTHRAPDEPTQEPYRSQSAPPPAPGGSR